MGLKEPVYRQVGSFSPITYGITEKNHPLSIAHTEGVT